MKKRFFPLFFAFFLTMSLILTGCENNKPAQTGETRIVVDGLGREVAIPIKCDKIAGVDAFTGEVMTMIGAGDQMVCCPGGVKSDQLLRKIYPNLVNIPVVQSAGEVNAEALLDLEPDVILIKSGIFCADSEKKKIEKLGIPYLVIKYRNMEEQIASLRLIGDVAGEKAKEKAEQIADYYEKTIDLVLEKSSKIPKSERLSVYHSINGATRTDNESSLGADWIKAVGLKNVSVGENLIIEGETYSATKEQIFVWDPDIIVCNDALTAKFFKESDMFSGLRAVKDGRVYNIPVGATRWGQQGSTETFFGMIWLGKTVYPEYYSDIDLKQEVFDFYENVLNITLDDEIYETILSGEGIRQTSRNSGR